MNGHGATDRQCNNKIHSLAHSTATYINDHMLRVLSGFTSSAMDGSSAHTEQGVLSMPLSPDGGWFPSNDRDHHLANGTAVRHKACHCQDIPDLFNSGSWDGASLGHVPQADCRKDQPQGHRHKSLSQVHEASTSIGEGLRLGLADKAKGRTTKQTNKQRKKN